MRRPSRKALVVAAVTALDVGCLLAVACLGRALVPPAEDAPEGPLVSAGEGPLISDRIEAQARTPIRATVAREEPMEAEEGSPRRAPSEGIDRAEPGTEAEFYEALCAEAQQGPGALEDAARRVLAAEGPVCGHVAALRALRDVGSPETDPQLLRAVLGLPDVSSDRSDSVPRFALRALAERAASSPEALRSLEIVAFGPYPTAPPASGMRAAAVAALCRVADAAERARIDGFLLYETDEVVLASARAELAPGMEQQ